MSSYTSQSDINFDVLLKLDNYLHGLNPYINHLMYPLALYKPFNVPVGLI